MSKPADNPSKMADNENGWFLKWPMFVRCWSWHSLCSRLWPSPNFLKSYTSTNQKWPMYPNSESTRQKDQSTSTGDKCGFIKILNPLTSTNADGSAFLNIRSIAKPFDWSFFLNSSTSISASFSVSCGKINENRDNSDSLLLTLFTRFTEIKLLKFGLFDKHFRGH